MEKELAALQQEITEIKAKINRAIGQRDTILKRLETEYGVSSLAEAKELVAQLREQEAASKAKWEELKAEYEALCANA